MTGRVPSAGPMKILLILTYYNPHWTGLTVFARRLAEGLARHGHEVTVLTSRHEKTLPLEETLNGVRVVRLPALFRMSRGVVMPTFPIALWRLIKDADIVNVHIPILEAPLIAFYARRLGRPVVYTHHGDLTMPGDFFNQFTERVVTGFMSQALRGASAVTVSSADYGRQSPFLRPFRDKLHSIYPPVEIPEPDPSRVTAWKNDLGLARSRIVGFAGRWVEEKGFDYLLRAIPEVVKAVPEAHFLYAGQTRIPYENFFERCAPLLAPVAQHVTMLGLLSDPRELANFYAMCDVFALPSRTDCFNLAQVEAMICGTPVVATDIPGAREVVSVTGMGLHVPPHDPSALAAGIIEALGRPEHYRRPSERIRALFNTDRCIREFESLFSRCLPGRTAEQAPSPEAARESRL
jgi:glycosyltransferase involved in cell wall biosynthesis